MAEEIEAKCGACVAWMQTEVPGPVTIGQPKQGVCRMNPPTPVPVYGANGQVAGQMHMRPVLKESDCCLQFVSADAAIKELQNALKGH